MSETTKQEQPNKKEDPQNDESLEFAKEANDDNDDNNPPDRLEFMKALRDFLGNKCLEFN